MPLVPLTFVSDIGSTAAAARANGVGISAVDIFAAVSSLGNTTRRKTSQDRRESKEEGRRTMLRAPLPKALRPHLSSCHTVALADQFPRASPQGALTPCGPRPQDPFSDLKSEVVWIGVEMPGVMAYCQDGQGHSESLVEVSLWRPAHGDQPMSGRWQV